MFVDQLDICSVTSVAASYEGTIMTNSPATEDIESIHCFFHLQAIPQYSLIKFHVVWTNYVNLFYCYLCDASHKQCNYIIVTVSGSSKRLCPQPADWFMYKNTSSSNPIKIELLSTRRSNIKKFTITYQG